MKVLDLNGRERSVQLAKYRVDWDHKVSAPQLAVKQFLKPYWMSHVVTEELRIPGSKLRIDLIDWTTRVIIEVSPSGSHDWNPFFHKNRHRFGAAKQRDLDKVAWAEANKFTYIELTDDDLSNLSPEWFAEKHNLHL